MASVKLSRGPAAPLLVRLTSIDAEPKPYRFWGALLVPVLWPAMTSPRSTAEGLQAVFDPVICAIAWSLAMSGRLPASDAGTEVTH